MVNTLSVNTSSYIVVLGAFCHHLFNKRILDDTR